MLGAGALGRPRGLVQGGRREEGSGWGTHVYLCISSEELLSGYDTLGSYKLPDPRKPWLEAAHG